MCILHTSSATVKMNESQMTSQWGLHWIPACVMQKQSCPGCVKGWKGGNCDYTEKVCLKCELTNVFNLFPHSITISSKMRQFVVISFFYFVLFCVSLGPSICKCHPNYNVKLKLKPYYGCAFLWAIMKPCWTVQHCSVSYKNPQILQMHCFVFGDVVFIYCILDVMQIGISPALWCWVGADSWYFTVCYFCFTSTVSTIYELVRVFHQYHISTSEKSTQLSFSLQLSIIYDTKFVSVVRIIETVNY